MSGILVLLLRVVMAVSLYAFLGLVIFLVWKDLRQQGTAAARQQIPPLTLQVQGEGSRREFIIRNAEAVIGRDPGCEVRLEDGTISARHARLRYHHKQWWLEDLNSTNGTMLNDQPVRQSAVLDSGDRITCGSFELRLQEAPSIP
jgi:pSer/pThr/pTyr-binding forkhead associated (FHA) protein